MDAGLTIEILLVEDNPADAEIIRRCFDAWSGCRRLHVVGDGQQALDFLRQRGEHDGEELPDLVLLDLNLPRLSGFEVLKEMRNDQQLRSIPVMVLTASAIAEDIHRVHSLNAQRYLAKPTDPADFVDVVAEVEEGWLELAAARRPPA